MIKVAVLWIMDESGEVLLARRALHKAQDPGVWGPAVTGKLESGETFDQALVREVEEELGLTTQDYTPRFLFKTDYHHPDGEVRRFGIYLTTFPRAKTELIQVDPKEVAGVQWFKAEELKQKMMVASNELVPSANAVWPETFKLIWPELYLADSGQHH